MGFVMELVTLDALPEKLLDEQARDLHTLLSGPTLIHLPGRRPEPLFVSVLLHGNEDTGFKALQAVLKRHAGRELPRALSVFIGNVAAARHGVRRLEEQVDYNRVWPGSESPAGVVHDIMAQVVAQMKMRHVFASIDIHNNTGLNPHYGCVNRLDHRFLHLATLFSRIVVYFTRPRGVQSAAFAEICPAVTVECGKPSLVSSEEHATDFIEACLNLSHFPGHVVAKHDVDLYHTVATVKVPAGISFGFGDKAFSICFRDDLDHLNFREIPAQTPFGTAVDGAMLETWNEAGHNITGNYFEVVRNTLRTRRVVTPAMLTMNADIIRQDCLCYLMERYSMPD
jgi:succinylglutamate desuccinylase